VPFAPPERYFVLRGYRAGRPIAGFRGGWCDTSRPEPTVHALYSAPFRTRASKSGGTPVGLPRSICRSRGYRLHWTTGPT